MPTISRVSSSDATKPIDTTTPLEKNLSYIRWKFYSLLCNPYQSFHVPVLGPVSLLEIVLIAVAFAIVIALCLSGGETGASGAIVEKVIFATVFLAMRNNILCILLKLPFRSMLLFHKMLGVVALVGGLLHGIPQIWDTSNISDKDLSGVITLAMIAAQPILYFIKYKNFEVFYYLHISVYVVMMVFAHSHGASAVLYSVACLCVDLLIRTFLMTKKCDTQITQTPGRVVKLTCNKPFDYKHQQIVFVMIPEISPFEWHPFSIASNHKEEKLVLMAGVVGGWTSALWKLAEEKSNITTFIDGPYNNSTIDYTDDKYGIILLVSGGTGITHNMSTLKYLLNENKLSPTSKVFNVWAMKEKVMGFIDTMELPFQNLHGSFIINPLQVLSKHSSVPSTTPAGEISATPDIEAAVDPTDRVHNEFYISGVHHDHVFSTDQYSYASCLHAGRPELHTLFKRVKNACKEMGKKHVAVSVCGPSHMTKICMGVAKEMSDDDVLFHIDIGEFTM